MPRSTSSWQKCRLRSRRSGCVRQLAAGEKQKLEILKQLYLGSRIVILDEPTSVLTPDEADSVLGMLREMTRTGELSVLMITHKFREVTRFCDEVTVLRKGRFAGSGKVSELTTAQMAQMMVGAETANRVRCARGFGQSSLGPGSDAARGGRRLGVARAERG